MGPGLDRVLRPAGRAGWALLMLLAMAVGEAHAQRPARPPVRQDTTARDTAPADSARKAPPSAADAAADSILRVLRTLPGYVATEYRAERAVYQTDEGVLRLHGKAEVTRAGDKLTADTILYRERQQLVEASGGPEVSGQAQELKGRRLFYDLARRRATAVGAETKVTEVGTWFVRGDVTLQGTNRIYATHGQFTTCDLAIPHYHFEADRIKVVKDKYLVARPARLYFGKVPVMVLPFVVQSLEQGRRSGLIVPRFSITDIVRNSPGHTRQISQLGYYWAVNEYLGAQLSGTWRSGAYTALQGSLDYRWRRQFLNGNLTFQRYWQNSGKRDLSFATSSSWQPDERTSLSVSGNYASSSTFIRESTIDPMEATQDLVSLLNLNRRFDWGTLAFGADRRQSVADNSTTYTLPSFSLSPNPITFFRSPTPEQASWYSNATVSWGLTGSRNGTSGKADFRRRIQDFERTNLQGGLQSLTIGKLNLSATGTLNQEAILSVEGVDSAGRPAGLLPGRNSDVGQWQVALGFQQNLLGQTVLTPSLGLGQEIRRDTLTGGRYLQGPTRLNFGANLSTALFGFYPGIGPFDAIRHRLTPTLGYAYLPQVQQSELQERVFGEFGGTAQNVVTLTLNQTWEAKLKAVEGPEPGDTVGRGATRDSASAVTSTPTEPQKVTLLSITTSAVSYDFNRAARQESGFTTASISNSITSDYLRGLQLQVQHDLFDQSEIDPSNPAQRNRMGRFSPRLSQLSTGFELGPNSTIFRWLGLTGHDQPATQGVQPGNSPTERVTPQGTGTATGNPQSVGSGPWRAGIQYSFMRPPRVFRNFAGLSREQIETLRGEDEAVQTVNADMAFSLTPAWAVTWGTSYSITDREFGAHRLNFKRDLHRWQANFSFYKTPSGNTAFEFFVELIDNRDLKVNYRDYNLGIDRRGR